ncbi:hypothetical protein K443DRAFT_680529 [Laccaria amethystina LaAM-08-1]|uniref:Uncharacterized protein n=1 Tax=Laccaria amethystina LaAM-08-1 TaxID=1095629 RepID=A0A0C9X0M4_9AGAR|nr:hypothetical protein K443DRAFT_680529 [Laccaria amethystina LaAM-08-1]
MRRTTLPSSIGYVFEMLSEAYNYCIATSIPIFNATLPRKGNRSRHPLNTPYVPLFESTHPTKRLSDDVFACARSSGDLSVKTIPLKLRWKACAKVDRG